MEIRQVLEQIVGKERVAEEFFPIDDRIDYSDVPISSIRIVTVRGAGWLVDHMPWIDFEDGDSLNKFLEDVTKFYEQNVKKSLKIDVRDSMGGTVHYLILGTRSKAIKEFVKNYQAATN